MSENPTANPLYWDKVPKAEWSHVLPQEPGWYFWYNLDLGYFEVGAVHVLKDTKKHLERLKGSIKEGKGFSFYIYQNDKGETLTMYHQATRGSPEDSHVPHADENGRPYVDGYIPFNFDELLKGELK